MSSGLVEPNTVRAASRSTSSYRYVVVIAGAPSNTTLLGTLLAMLTSRLGNINDEHARKRKEVRVLQTPPALQRSADHCSHHAIDGLTPRITVWSAQKSRPYIEVPFFQLCVPQLFDPCRPPLTKRANQAFSVEKPEVEPMAPEGLLCGSEIKTCQLSLSSTISRMSHPTYSPSRMMPVRPSSGQLSRSSAIASTLMATDD